MPLHSCVDLRLGLTLDQHLTALVTEVPGEMVTQRDRQEHKKDARITPWSDALHVSAPFGTLDRHSAA